MKRMGQISKQAWEAEVYQSLRKYSQEKADRFADAVLNPPKK